MKGHVFAVVLVAMVVCCVGCESVQKGTHVQKGSAVGAGAGTVLGGGIGHLTAFGGVPGALVGLGLGAAAGAIAAEQLYESEDSELDIDPEQIQELSNQLAVRDAQVSELRGALEQEATQKQALLEAHEKLRSEIANLQGQFGADIAVERGPQGGLKLTILSEVLFDSGKAALTKKGKAVLAQAAATIRREYPGAVIEVRGHTDNVPIRYSSYKSNWELSCARSLSVVHYLIEAANIPPDRLMAVGLADTQPVASNDTPEGRRANRRAEIVIRPAPQLGQRQVAASR